MINKAVVNYILANKEKKHTDIRQGPFFLKHHRNISVNSEFGVSVLFITGFLDWVQCLETRIQWINKNWVKIPFARFECVTILMDFLFGYNY